MPAEPSHPSFANPTRVFRDFDRSVEQTLGADTRLLYGMTIPILMVCGLIVVLALTPQTWMVIGVLVVEAAALGLVVTGLLGMLSDDGEDDPEPP
ncbi:MAG TPA: hypothetical protein VME22_29860 [Solirubrobacteraceae bacterium]|nr:hypothetical protein [Solirubrobacteraceae bacterium]